MTRARNPKWQRDLRRYLTSGQAVILHRAPTGISPATRRFVTSGGVLASAHGVRLYRTPPSLRHATPAT
jgi:hypothetical protein